MLSKSAAPGGCAARDGILDTASPSSGVEKMMDCPDPVNVCACTNETAVTAIPAAINHLFKFEKLKSIYDLTR